MKYTLVTGANGFVGRKLCLRLLRDNCKIRAAIRQQACAESLPAEVEPVVVGSIGPDTFWGEVLNGIDTVFHLAARVHIMRETASNPLEEFRSVNTLGTINLARQAAIAGVRRLIFMSTIGVNGNSTNGKLLDETDPPSPNNPYSKSKMEAEELLALVTAETDMEVVVLRAPLVYGPGNPGNFHSLLRAVSIHLPLPLASISNKRSFIYIDNLTDAISACAEHPYAAGQTYLVSDGEDVSTPLLIKLLAEAMGTPARLFPLPPALLRLAGKITGKSAMVERLVESLQVDNSKIRRELGWTPPFTMEQGLRETAEWYMRQARGNKARY